MVVGLPKINDFALFYGCIYGKETRMSFLVGKARRKNQSLEIAHAYLCGPKQTTSLGGGKYFIMLTDDYIKMSSVYFLESIREAIKVCKKFKALVEKQSGQLVKVLQSDRGGEFISTEFKRRDSS